MNCTQLKFMTLAS